MVSADVGRTRGRNRPRFVRLCDTVSAPLATEPSKQEPSPKCPRRQSLRCAAQGLGCGAQRRTAAGPPRARRGRERCCHPISRASRGRSQQPDVDSGAAAEIDTRPHITNAASRSARPSNVRGRRVRPSTFRFGTSSQRREGSSLLASTRLVRHLISFATGPLRVARRRSTCPLGGGRTHEPQRVVTRLRNLPRSRDRPPHP